MKPLTPKQERFCLEYAKSGNATQAYKAAGYTAGKSNDQQLGVNAHRLLKNDKVQKRLAELAEEVKNAEIADVAEMQKVLTKIIRQELDEEVIVVEGIGMGESQAVTKTKKAAFKDIVAAIDKLARMQGAYNDKVNVTGAVPVIISGENELPD